MMNSRVKKFLFVPFGLIFLVFPFGKAGFDEVYIPEPIDTAQTLTLLFVGDVMQHQSQIDAAYNNAIGAYEYDSCFKFISPVINSYDIAIANLEVTLGGTPYTGYPQFSAPDELAAALVNSGFDYLLTANNHSCDRGLKGINRTIDMLDSFNIPHTGTFINSSERADNYPLIINEKGIKLALLNYTYGTNGLAVPSPAIVNLIDKDVIASDLKKAKDSLPDKIIVCIHWGDEYKSHPNQWQQDMAKFILDNGADIVIGSHPHVLQRMEYVPSADSNGKETLVVYSLGNYISNQRDRYKDGGASLAIELRKNGDKTEIVSTAYYLTWVWTTYEEGRKKYYIVPVSQYENETDFMDAESKAKMKIFSDDSRSLYGSENKSVPENIFDINTKVWRQE